MPYFFRLLPVVLFTVLAAFTAEPKRPTALDRYVREPDSSYRYEVAVERSAGDVSINVLNMTSQTWRSASEVDRPAWKHWLTIIKPAEVKHSTAFLFITGGSNRDIPPERTDPWMVEMARYTKSVVVELRNVPNQPLVFAGETRKRSEDEMISYTWDRFLRGGDDLWPARLPMTKAAVRAMDTVTAFLGDQKRGALRVDRFVVAGGSKRGWTTWTTAAVDSRVVAIVPAVIDVLNVEKSMQHHWRVYGFWTPAVGDYKEMKLFDWFATPQNRALMKIEDPYEYRDRLTLPKYIVNAGGDQFFAPDSSQFYFDDLKGEKYLRYVPNTDHSLRKSDALETIGAFYDSVLNNRPRPRLSWKLEKDGAIRVKTHEAPTEVKLWQATNPEKRDFRLETLGPKYTSSVLTAKSGSYEAMVTKPEKGWTAYFVELTYSTGGKYPLKVTTPVRVVPETLPFEEYRPDVSVTKGGGR
ncbi:MAG: PhoPQ-activated pathogenicity-related family protein [Bryobacteraceae bacterium]